MRKCTGSLCRIIQIKILRMFSTLKRDLQFVVRICKRQIVSYLIPIIHSIHPLPFFLIVTQGSGGRKEVKKMNHYPRTPEEQEQLDKKMLEETERYYARLDLKYGIAFALSIIALLINVINLLRL